MLSARQLVPLGLLVVAGIAFIGAGGHKYLSFTALAENRDWLCSLVERWGVTAALLYIAVYCLLVALSVPGAAVLTIAGGFLFGIWLGALCAVIGATLGATAIFLAARAGLGGLAQRAGRFVGKARGRLSRRCVQLSAGCAAGAGLSVLARQPRSGTGRRQIADVCARHLSWHHSRHVRLRHPEAGSLKLRTLEPQ